MGGMPLFFGFNSSYSCNVELEFDFETKVLAKDGKPTESLDILPQFNQNQPEINLRKKITLEENNSNFDLQKTLESNQNYNSISKWKSSEFAKYILVLKNSGLTSQNEFLSTNNFDFQDKMYIYNKTDKRWATLELTETKNLQVLTNYLQKMGKIKKTIIQIGFGKDETIIFAVLEDQQTLNKKAGDELEVSGIAIGFVKKDGKIILLE